MPQHDPKLHAEDIHAFFDGELDPDRRQEIVNMIKEDPETIRRLAEYATQNEGMHLLFDFMLSEAVPDRLLQILEEYRGGSEGVKPEV